MNTKLRARVLERDRFKCRGCGKSPDEIHHIIFRSQGGKDTMENLVALCRSCHEQAHGRRQAPLPAWVLQAMIIYNRWRVCCNIWRFFVEKGNCLTCELRTNDYVCMLTDEKVDPLYGCESYGLRSLSYHC